jgi:hypothetical protein
MFLLRLYMTRLVLHFLGSKLSSASINHMTNTWVLRATHSKGKGAFGCHLRPQYSKLPEALLKITKF